MQLISRATARRLMVASAALALLAFAAVSSYAQDDDPPAQAGRISYISGDVSIQQVGSDDWGQAVPNFPFGPGDRIFTDSNGRAEIQIGQTFFRIGPNSDVSFMTDNPRSLAIGLARGSVHMHAYGLWPGQLVHINTPSGSGGVDSAGEELRVDVIPGQDAALFTNLGVQAFAVGTGFAETLHRGQALELVGSNPVVPQWMQPAQADGLDYWSQQRDQQIANVASYRYVSPEIPGAYELDAAGTWMPGTEYGAIWFPNVAYGWAPYHNGHWVNHAPWGQVWIEDESWGYAPFHYGRWVNYQGRWGWLPGAPAAHPVWSPALVAFAGGIHVGGISVTAWFPLGPGEAYHPWYHCSPQYQDQVNRTNIQETRIVHVQNTYVTNVTNVTNVTYVNRTTVTAMDENDFAAGRSASKASVVVDARQMNNVQVVQRPAVEVSVKAAVVPPSHPVPVSTERPAVINESGKLATAKPGSVPVAPPVKPAPVVKPLPGHTVVAPPAGAKPIPVAAKTETETKPVMAETKPAATTESKPASTPAAATKPTTAPANTTTPDNGKPQHKKGDKKTPPPTPPAN